MIRNVSLRDAKAIVDIYNEYVVNSVATFETEPLRVEEMEGRIAGISASYPYLVYVDQDEVVGYCYAHTWKRQLINIRLRPPFIYPRDTRARGSAGSLWKG